MFGSDGSSYMTTRASESKADGIICKTNLMIHYNIQSSECHPNVIEKSIPKITDAYPLHENFTQFIMKVSKTFMDGGGACELWAFFQKIAGLCA